MTQPNYNYQSQSKKHKRKRKKNKNHNQYYPKQQYSTEANMQQKQQSSNEKLLVIDGSMMEGGGQILRNSTTFSALMKIPIHITKIRGKRSTPGLRKQHSKGIELVSKINGGFVEGNYVKSMNVKYYPSGKPSFITNYSVDIETAGSVCLLMQISVPLFLFSPLQSQCTLTCIGGTNASFAPQIDYYQLILQPMLQRLMNINIDIKCIQRGFFPRGGGKILLQTNPIETYIPSFDLTKRGKIIKVYGRVIVGGRGLPLSIGDDVIRGAVRELQMCFGKNMAIQIDILPKDKIESYSEGVAIVMRLETDSGCLFGGSGLSGAIGYGNRGKGKGRGRGRGKVNYEEIGRVAARELLTDWNSTKSGCTDRWLQDQLIIFMALAKGKSRMATCAMELHTETAIYIAELFTGVKFNVSNMKDGTVLIECDGCAYMNGKGKEKTEEKDNNNDEENQANDESNEQNKSGLLSNRPSLF